MHDASSLNCMPTTAARLRGEALSFFTALYDIEREAAAPDADERQRLRQRRAKPVCDAVFEWLVAQRKLVAEGSATVKALDYSLKRWDALTHYLEDGNAPIDNNWFENQSVCGQSDGPIGCSPDRCLRVGARPPS